MNYLIDTDIIIYSLKDNPAVVKNFREKAAHPKSISVITYGELLFGAEKSTHVEKNIATVRAIAEIFPIINISRSIIETFANMKALLVKHGTTVADMDLFIAATAITNNMILVTHNIKHFSKIPELEIENWTT